MFDFYVLILVCVEVSVGDAQSKSYQREVKCLNPCLCGSQCGSCNGCKVVRFHLQAVLILVCVEVSVGAVFVVESEKTALVLILVCVEVSVGDF